MVWPNVRRSDLVTEQACETNTSTKCVLTHFSEFYGGGCDSPCRTMCMFLVQHVSYSLNHVGHHRPRSVPCYPYLSCFMFGVGSNAGV